LPFITKLRVVTNYLNDDDLKIHTGKPVHILTSSREIGKTCHGVGSAFS